MAMGAFSQEKVTPCKDPPRAVPGKCFPQCPAVELTKKSQQELLSRPLLLFVVYNLPNGRSPGKSFVAFCDSWIQCGGCCSSKSPGPVSSEAERVFPTCTHKNTHMAHTHPHAHGWLYRSAQTHTQHTQKHKQHQCPHPASFFGSSV